MQLTETARIRLMIDGEDASSAITKIDQHYDALIEKQAKYVKGSKEWKEVEKEIRSTAKSMEIMKSRADVTAMTFTELTRYQRELRSAMRGMQEGTEDYIRASAKLTEVNTRVNALKKDMYASEQSVQKSKGTWDNLKSWIIGAFAVQAVIAFGRRVIEFGKEVFDLTAKFETYNTILKNTLGGQNEAAAAMEMIKDVAATTPISVDEMTDSFIKYVNRGVKPTMDEIKKLADLAASQGKSFDQLTEAVLDAQMGEGERLKEFGIKMKKSGDDISLSFKGQTTSVKNNEQAIYDAIVAMGDYNGVAGMTSEISKTLEGRVSNLGDAWDFVQLKLGDKLKPIFLFILDLFAKGVEWVGRLIDATQPLGTYYGILADLFSQVWNIGKELFLSLMPEGATNMITLSNVFKVMAAVMGTMLLGIKAVVSSFQVLIDSFRIAAKAGEVFWRVVKGDYAGAASSAKEVGLAWDKLKSNATKNFGSIEDSLKKLWGNTSKSTEIATDKVDMYGKLTKKTEEEVTKLTDAELKKRNAAKEKALKTEEKQLLKHAEDVAKIIKELDDTWIESEQNEIDRNKKKLMAKYEDELLAFEKSGATKEQYAQKEKDLKEKLLRELEELDIKSREKIAKENKTDNAKKEKALEEHVDNLAKIIKELDDTWIESEKNEVDRNKKKLMAKYEDELLAFEKSGATKEQYAQKEKDLKEKLLRELEDLDKKANKVTLKGFAEIKQAIIDLLNDEEELRKQVIKTAWQLVGDILNNLEANIDRQLALATTATEKAVLEQKKAWISVADSAMGALDQLASGNVVGAIVGGLRTLWGALNNWVFKSSNLMKAQLADLKAELLEAGQAFYDLANKFTTGVDLTALEKAYDGLFQLMERDPFYDLVDANNYETRINAEIAVANAINDNYNTAIKREEEYSKNVIDNINKAYSEDIKRINDKYDLLARLGKQNYDADALAIKANLSEQLLGLISNEESKTSVIAEFAAERSKILKDFALADQVITADTDQATIDAINAAIEARNKALVDLQNWYNTELEIVINTEGQKRKEYTETEELKRASEKALADLERKRQAEEIQLTLEKNQEIEAAQKNKNAALEAEAERFNDVILQLGLARDEALAASFTRLKELVNAGYDEMMAKANAAYAAGKLTMDQFNELVQSLQRLQNQVNGFTIDTSKWPSFDNINLNLPSFEQGAIIPRGSVIKGSSHADGGIDLYDRGRGGMYLGNMQGDEMLGVFSKEITRKHGALLLKLANSNLLQTGKPFYAEDGVFGTLGDSSQDNNSMFSNNNGYHGFALQEDDKLLLAMMDVAAILQRIEFTNERISQKRFGVSLSNLVEANRVVETVDEMSTFG